jgi:hypothetical protein
MADQDQLGELLARLDAALGAAACEVDGLVTRPDLSDALAEAERRAEDAEGRVAALETELAEARAVPQADPDEPDRMRAAFDDLLSAVDALREGREGAMDDSLRAEAEALRAARALDLAELNALLAELEPLLEPANA